MLKQFVIKNGTHKLIAVLRVPQQAIGTIIILPGLYMTKAGPCFTYTKLATWLFRLNYQVLQFDYFGHGDSEGDFSEVTWETIFSDAQCVLRLVKQELKAKQIGLFGHGIGGIAACYLAAENSFIQSSVILAPRLGNLAKYSEVLKQGGLEILHKANHVETRFLVDWETYSPAENFFLSLGAFYSIDPEFISKQLLESLTSLEPVSKLKFSNCPTLLLSNGSSFQECYELFAFLDAHPSSKILEFTNFDKQITNPLLEIYWDPKRWDEVCQEAGNWYNLYLNNFSG